MCDSILRGMESAISRADMIAREVCGKSEDAVYDREIDLTNQIY